jgi:hypothetical protein
MLPTQCIYVFRIVLTTQNVSILKEYSSVGLIVESVCVCCEVPTELYVPVTVHRDK